MDTPERSTERTARALGGMSLALGTPMILSPMTVARAAGLDDSANATRMVRAVGWRELAEGALLLVGPRWSVWSRVAGDAMDVAVLGSALAHEAHTDFTPVHLYDKGKQMARLQTDRPTALREAILACANGGTVSVMGAYGGLVDKFPIGSIMNRSLTLRSGQCYAHRYMRPLLDRIRKGEIDPGYIISHRMPLEEAPKAYEMFKSKDDRCTKVVLTP